MYSDESSRSLCVVAHMWVCVDGRALAAGGMGSDLLPRSILQQYDLRKDVWALLPPMPTPRYDANTHLLANKLYVAGIDSQWVHWFYINFNLCVKQQKSCLTFSVRTH